MSLGFKLHSIAVPEVYFAMNSPLLVTEQMDEVGGKVFLFLFDILFFFLKVSHEKEIG